MARTMRTCDWLDFAEMAGERWPYCDGSYGDDPDRGVCFGHDASSTDEILLPDNGNDEDECMWDVGCGMLAHLGVGACVTCDPAEDLRYSLVIYAWTPYWVVCRARPY